MLSAVHSKGLVCRKRSGKIRILIERAFVTQIPCHAPDICLDIPLVGEYFVNLYLVGEIVIYAQIVAGSKSGRQDRG